MDITRNQRISLTKNEKAINPNAKCPATIAMFISINSGADRNRTCDLFRAREALSR